MYVRICLFVGWLVCLMVSHNVTSSWFYGLVNDLYIYADTNRYNVSINCTVTSSSVYTS